MGPVWTTSNFLWVDLAAGPAVALLLVAVATRQPKPWCACSTPAPMRSLGSFSYSLYLTHAPIVVVVYTFVVGPLLGTGIGRLRSDAADLRPRHRRLRPRLRRPVRDPLRQAPQLVRPEGRHRARRAPTRNRFQPPTDQDQGTDPLVERQEGPLPGITPKIKGRILAFTVRKGPFLTSGPRPKRDSSRSTGGIPLPRITQPHAPTVHDQGGFPPLRVQESPLPNARAGKGARGRVMVEG